MISALKRKGAFVVAPIINYLRSPPYRRAKIYTRYYDQFAIEKKVILYESCSDATINNHLYTIFQAMLKDLEYRDYTHILSVKNMEEVSHIIKMYETRSNVKFVDRDSRQYLKCLATCEYIISDLIGESYLIAKAGQTHINIWQGSSFKNTGFDLFDNTEYSQTTLQNLMSVDYLLSYNSVTTEYFLENYKLKGAFGGKIVEIKSPITGEILKRTIKEIINQRQGCLNIVRHPDDKKQRILIYPGNMHDNGITSSFLNLMNNIDYEKYDITCFTDIPNTKERLKNLKKLDSKVRLILKSGIPAYKMSENYCDKITNLQGERSVFGRLIYPYKAYEREIKRLFGKAEFDLAIDFSGYSLYWAKYILAAQSQKKICFMHNDLLSDSERVVSGKKIHLLNLRSLFSVYHHFDKLVSVSKGTMELNLKNLSNYASADKFGYVMNTINPEKIINSDKEEIMNSIVDSAYVNFVNMGRLSPEKGQNQLIKAFGEFKKSVENSRLYILGKGPLQQELQQLIQQLNLQDSVFLVGQLENPFTFMKQCDCFILSSHYEGQPMVLLEAMTLGMKIIATDIVANRTVLEDGKYGLLVENNVYGLTNGMLFIANKGEAYQPEPFNYHEYNKKALETFMEACET